MSIIKQLLLQLHQGQSKKQIVRDMGISKNTLRRYLRLLQGCSFTLAQLIQMDEPEIERILNNRVSVNKDHQCDLDALFPWVKKELKRTGVTRFTLWGEYRKRYSEGYSYSQFFWFFFAARAKKNRCDLEKTALSMAIRKTNLNLINETNTNLSNNYPSFQQLR